MRKSAKRRKKVVVYTSKELTVRLDENGILKLIELVEDHVPSYYIKRKELTK